MAYEHPIAIRPRARRQKKCSSSCSSDKICIIHNVKNKTDTVVRPLTGTSWSKIIDSAKQRQLCMEPSQRLDDICCAIPDEFDDRHHGFHRKCYQTFTNVKCTRKRKSDDSCEADMPQPSTSKRSRIETSKRAMFPSDQCLICGRKYKLVHGGKGKTVTRENLTQSITRTAEITIKEAAELKRDEKLLCQIRDVDLIAKEAYYHNSCRRNYTRKDRHGEVDLSSENAKQIRAHEKAFAYITGHIETNVIRGSQVERMTMICKRYCSYMQEHHPEFYNPNYKTNKLKSKLIKHFGKKIRFWRPNYRSELVYSDLLPTGQAIEAAFESAASEERRLEEAGHLLHRLIIIDTFRKSPELPWPPCADHLLSCAISPPDELIKFLTCLISGNAKSSPRKARLVQSISQDICYAASRGQWKMPKHLL